MDKALREGAKNLLVNCAGLEGGESLVVFHEDPALDWYDRAAPEAVASTARSMGMTVSLIQVNAPGDNDGLAGAIETAVRSHDQVVHFARLGDQDRFAPSNAANPPVMSYVTDAAGLASQFGRFDHAALLALKSAVNAILDRAAEIRVTCPAGTQLTGRVLADSGGGPEDVSVKRFPMGVYKPLPMTGFKGRVALTRYLTPTGSRPYEPAVVPIDSTVWAHVDAGKILEFEGEADDVARIHRHYRHVSDLFGIDPLRTHSWHSGIHPACAFSGRAEDDPAKWGNSVFCNPRVMHCHTCGDYAPGEICWMVFDPTISVDGRVLWDKGRMNPDHSPDLRRVCNAWPGFAALLKNPGAEIGLK